MLTTVREGPARYRAIFERCFEHCMRHTDSARGASVWCDTFALPALAKLVRDNPSYAARAGPAACATGMLTEVLDRADAAAGAAFAAGAEQAGLLEALYEALAADAKEDTPARAARTPFDGADGSLALLSQLTSPSISHMNPEGCNRARAPLGVVMRFCTAALERLNAQIPALRGRLEAGAAVVHHLERQLLASALDDPGAGLGIGAKLALPIVLDERFATAVRLRAEAAAEAAAAELLAMEAAAPAAPAARAGRGGGGRGQKRGAAAGRQGAAAEAQAAGQAAAAEQRAAAEATDVESASIDARMQQAMAEYDLMAKKLKAASRAVLLGQAGMRDGTGASMYDPQRVRPRLLPVLPSSPRTHF